MTSSRDFSGNASSQFEFSKDNNISEELGDEHAINGKRHNRGTEKVDLAEKILQTRRQLSLETTLETADSEPVESDDIFCIRHRNADSLSVKPTQQIRDHPNHSSPGITRRLQLLTSRRKSCIIDESHINNNAKEEEEEEEEKANDAQNNASVLDSCEEYALQRSPSLNNHCGGSMQRGYSRSSSRGGWVEDEQNSSSEDEDMYNPHEIDDGQLQPTKQKTRLPSSGLYISNDDGLLPSDSFTTFEVDPTLEKKANSLFSASTVVTDKPPPSPSKTKKIKPKSRKKSLGGFFRKSKQESKDIVEGSRRSSAASLTDACESLSDEDHVYTHGKEATDAKSLMSGSSTNTPEKKKKKHFWSKKKDKKESPSKHPEPNCDRDCGSIRDGCEDSDDKSPKSDKRLNSKFGSMLSLQSNVSEASSKSPKKKRFGRSSFKKKQTANMDDSESDKGKKVSRFKKIALLMKVSKGFSSMSKSKSEGNVQRKVEESDGDIEEKISYESGSESDKSIGSEHSKLNLSKSKNEELAKTSDAESVSHNHKDKLTETYSSTPNLSEAKPSGEKKNKAFSKLKSALKFRSSSKLNKEKSEVMNNEIESAEENLRDVDLEYDNLKHSESKREKSSPKRLKRSKKNQDNASYQKSDTNSKPHGKDDEIMLQNDKQKDNDESETSDAWSQSTNSSKSSIKPDKSVSKGSTISYSSGGESDQSSYQDHSRHSGLNVEKSSRKDESNVESTPAKESFDDLETLNLSDNEGDNVTEASFSSSFSSESIESQSELGDVSEEKPKFDGKAKFQKAVMKLSSIKMFAMSGADKKAREHAAEEDSDVEKNMRSKVKRVHSARSTTGSIRSHRTVSRLSMVNAWTLDGDNADIDDLGDGGMDEGLAANDKAQRARARLKKAMFKFKVVKMMNDGVSVEKDGDELMKDLKEEEGDKVEDMTKVLTFSMDEESASLHDRDKVMPDAISKDTSNKVTDANKDSSENELGKQVDDDVSECEKETLDKKASDSKPQPAARFKNALKKLKVVTLFGSMKSLTKDETKSKSTLSLPAKSERESTDDAANKPESLPSDTSVDDVSDFAHSIHSDRELVKKKPASLPSPTPAKKNMFKRAVMGIQAANRLKSNSWAVQVRKAESMAELTSSDSPSHSPKNMLKRSSSSAKFKFWRKSSKSKIVEDEVVDSDSSIDRKVKKDERDIDSLSSDVCSRSSKSKSDMLKTKEVSEKELELNTAKKSNIQADAADLERNVRSAENQDQTVQNVIKTNLPPTGKLPPLKRTSSFRKIFKGSKKKTKDHVKKDDLQVTESSASSNDGESVKNVSKKSVFPVVIGLMKWKKRAKKDATKTQQSDNNDELLKCKPKECLESDKTEPDVKNDTHSVEPKDNVRESEKSKAKSDYELSVVSAHGKGRQKTITDYREKSAPKVAQMYASEGESDLEHISEAEDHDKCKVRLEQELEEARLKHEAEMKRQLDEAEKHMQVEVEKTKQKAQQKLNMQRDEYEDKLAELEKGLKEQKSKKYESEQQRLQMEANVKKLEQHKLMLEQEVLANRKRLQLEAVASQQAVSQSRINHSRIVEQLEKEKQKIQEDVQRLEERRQRRAMTPRGGGTPAAAASAARTPMISTVDSKGSSARKDLYRTALLVREANKIGQHLQKDTVFTREDVQDESGDGGSSHTVVKVTNTKLGISTFWSMDKFEDRLLQMREMYQGENQSGEECDSVFYDPKDQWEKDDRLSCSPGMSPVILKNLRKQHVGSPRTPLPGRLSFDSVSTASPDTRSRAHSVNTSQCLGADDVVVEEEQEEEETTSVVGLCRELISCSLEQQRGESVRETVADKLMQAADTLRGAVRAMLDGYQATQEGEQTAASYSESELVRGCSIQLAQGVGILLSLCSVWRSQYTDEDSLAVVTLFDGITASARTIGNSMVLFLQGCENDISSMVSSSSSRLMDAVYQLSRQCGELALATGTPTCCLRDTPAIHDDDMSGTLLSETQETPTSINKLGHDLRQQFLCGCDHFIDQSLQGGLRAVDACNDKIIAIGDLSRDDVKSISEDVLKQVELTVASSKVILEKLQDIQVQLDTTIRESSNDSMNPDYYHRNYLRCQGLITHVSNLADGVSLLTQATEALVKNSDDASHRRLYRCAEMIQKSTLKILATSLGDISINNNSSSSNFSQSDAASNPSSSPDSSLLSDSQLQTLDVAAQEMRLATNGLILAVKRELDNDSSSTVDGGKLTRSPSKSKRMLPLSPTKRGSFRGSPKHGKVKKMAALVDLAANNGTT